MQLTFLGATKTVTGSKYLITHHSKRILIDCGLFQGYKELRLRNWDTFPIAPHLIDVVILTHAHIDHSGYLPLLVKNGFKGKIFCTPGTAALCAILLPDSGHIHEEDAKRANRYGYTKHKPALPLYTEEDAKIALRQLQTMPFGAINQLFDDFKFSFHHAGHIIGAACVKIEAENKTILFTGDMGRPHDAVMRAPAIIDRIDYLVIESTYGDRIHDQSDPLSTLAKIINATIKRGGSIIIPAFAVGRAQSLLYYLYQLKQTKMIPDIPVFLDSPMAINATHVLCQFKSEHRLNEDECKKICETATYVNTADESKQLDIQNTSKIIISASGMATGGRILFHLKAFAPDPRNTIVFTGYQAGGTRGARIINGEGEVKIHGEMIPIRAHIESITSTSAHADSQELLNWCARFTTPPIKVFITHGEPASAESLKNKLREQLDWDCVVPHYQQTEKL